MGYRKIANLQINNPLLEFKEVFSMCKVDGTSAHISFKYIDDKWTYKVFAGGTPHTEFVFMLHTRYKLGTTVLEKLTQHTQGKDVKNVIVYGEAYGSKILGQGHLYGPLNFIAFEVFYPDLYGRDVWLGVKQAEKFVTAIGLPFVPYEKGPATIEWLTQQRDKPDPVAKMNGMGDDRYGEGIIVRAPMELYDENGGRLIAKYKREKFRETKTARTLTEEDVKLLEEAQEIAEEWVVEERLTHVLSKLVAAGHSKLEMKDTGRVVAAMTEDVGTEAVGQITWSQEAAKAIGRKTAEMFKRRVKEGRANPIEGV